MKIYKPAKERFDGCKVKPSEYIVEDFGAHCVIHRVLNSDEIEGFQEYEIAVTCNGDFIIPEIEKCETVERAESVIYSYWEAVEKLNTEHH
jgi:hypothetical protein